jgi:predicted PolB exonuclease-like 3'-5' exonuclease
MDTKTLITEAKARFNHNAAKIQLRDKYDSKLIVAEQGGLWKATYELIGFLSNSTGDTVILIDNFENPVLVNRAALYDVLSKTYNDTMQLWYSEWKELESKR